MELFQNYIQWCCVVLTDPILSQMNPVNTFPHYSLTSIPIISSHLRLAFTSALFPSGFRPKFCMPSHFSRACYIPNQSNVKSDVR